MSVPLARRQLLERKGRTVAGLLGIALALLLVLALKAILAGAEQRLTGYIDRSGADVIVAQRGVRTMHMTESALPEQTAAAIGALPGVAQVTPIVYVATQVERDGRRALVYAIGEDRSARTLPLASGRRAGPGEIVVDKALAGSLGAVPGAMVSLLGRRFRVVGQISGTASLASSVALTERAGLARVVGGAGTLSYVFVRAERGVGADDLAARIERAVAGVSATPRAEFSQWERRLVGDMSTDVVRAMIFVGFLIGVAVAGLVAYNATLSQLRDYAVLRAVGLRARRALALVLAQVGVLVAAGFTLALVLLLVLASALPALSPTLSLAIRTGDVLLALGVAVAVTSAAAALPVVRVARVDPAAVFRR